MTAEPETAAPETAVVPDRWTLMHALRGLVKKRLGRS